ncbi:desiccation-related protein PCC13-62-like [Chenopodium quinoa]|uniref:desiccation-related protein PCC13-62-like n=1 Tax=Chenopodium quinoa TaxID=63459 RepID=UPI000B76DA3D|nr:desiccation-related protein PCC13-62-like [Chenopodium quinoa]
MALPFTLKLIVIPFLILINVLCLSKGVSSSSKIVEHQRKSVQSNIPTWDTNYLEFPLNLEYLEVEFFLWGSIGRGLDTIAPELAEGGPPPIGVRKAFLDPFTNDVIAQFALQEVGHLRAIKEVVKGFPRPTLNLSSAQFSEVVNSAFEHPLFPPFDPYRNSINYLLASYLIPYVGLTGYVGTIPKLLSVESRKLVAGLLAVKSGQDAVIRSLLYQRRLQRVVPYKITVQEFTNRLSKLRNKLGSDLGSRDEGIFVDQKDGAEGKIKGNILVGDENSLGYPRSPIEVLNIVYGSGDPKKVGGFFPKGADGYIAQSYL